MTVLPAGSTCRAESFQASNGNFRVDWIQVHGETSPAEYFRNQQGRPGMSKEIDHQVARVGACADDAFNALHGLLRITARDVFFHAVEYLLDVHPDVPRPDGVGAASFQILRLLPVYVLVVPTQDLRYVGVFGIHVEPRFSPDIVEQFLPDGHPIPLSAVSTLVPHGDETARMKRLVPHHQDEVRQRLEPIGLIGPDPNVKGRIGRQRRLRMGHPSSAPINELPYRTSLERDQVIGRVLDRQHRLFSLHEAINRLPVGGVEAPDTMASEGIGPDFTKPKTTLRHQFLP